MLSLSNRRADSALYSRPLINPRLWLIPLVIALGIMTGLAISRGWIYCFGFCVLCLLLLWPVEVGLGAYAFFLPFDPISAIGGESTGTSISFVLGIVAGGAVLGTMLVRERFQRPPKSTIWWSVLIVWATVSSAWAIDPEHVFHRLPTALSLFILFMICTATRFEERELKVVALLSIAGACAAALYVTFFSPAGPAIGPAALRSSVAWGDRQADPNDFAASLLLPLSLALGGFLFARNRYARIMMLLAFGLISYAVLVTLSRGALVALLVMTILYIRYMPRHLRKRLVIPISIFVAALATMSTAIFERITMGVETGGAGRLDIWTAGLQAIKQHGLIGAGLDNFPLAYSEVAGYASRDRGLARAAHDIFLNIWVELGVPGLILFIAAMSSHLRAAKKVLRARADQFSAPVLICYAASCSVIVAGLFFDIVWRKTFWLTWTFLLLTLKFREAYRQRSVRDGQVETL